MVFWTRIRLVNCYPPKLFHGTNEPPRRTSQHVKARTDEKRHHDRAKKPRRTKSRMSLLGHFGHGFESGHKIRHNLKRQQDRNEGSGAKCRMKIDGGAANGANAQENHEEKKYDPRRPILKSGAPADSPVVQHCKKHRKPHAQQQTWKKNG